MRYRIILDTNVLVSALLSSSGASFRLLKMIDDKRIEIVVSTPLVKEYEDVLYREEFALSQIDIDNILDYICSISSHHKIYYLWRPVLKDIKDDMVLELAVKANAIIITHNKKDFLDTEKFGTLVLNVKEFLNLIEEL